MEKRVIYFVFFCFVGAFADAINTNCFTIEAEALSRRSVLVSQCTNSGRSVYLQSLSLPSENSYGGFCVGVVCNVCDSFYDNWVLDECCIQEKQPKSKSSFQCSIPGGSLGSYIGFFEFEPTLNHTDPSDFCTDIPQTCGEDGDGDSSDSGGGDGPDCSDPYELEHNPGCGGGNVCYGPDAFSHPECYCVLNPDDPSCSNEPPPDTTSNPPPDTAFCSKPANLNHPDCFCFTHPFDPSCVDVVTPPDDDVFVCSYSSGTVLSLKSSSVVHLNGSDFGTFTSVNHDGVSSSFNCSSSPIPSFSSISSIGEYADMYGYPVFTVRSFFNPALSRMTCSWNLYFCSFFSNSSGSSDNSSGSSDNSSGSSDNSSGLSGPYWCDLHPDDAICDVADYDEYCDLHPSEPFCVHSRNCSLNPSLPECVGPQTPKPPEGGGGGGDGGGGDNGGDNGGGNDSLNSVSCENLSNCDWAKLSTQLLELGVSEKALDSLSSLLAVVRSYVFSNDAQVAASVQFLEYIYGVLNGVGAGVENIRMTQLPQLISLVAGVSSGVGSVNDSVVFFGNSVTGWLWDINDNISYSRSQVSGALGNIEGVLRGGFFDPWGGNILNNIGGMLDWDLIQIRDSLGNFKNAVGGYWSNWYGQFGGMFSGYQGQFATAMDSLYRALGGIASGLGGGGSAGSGGGSSGSGSGKCAGYEFECLADSLGGVNKGIDSIIGILRGNCDSYEFFCLASSAASAGSDSIGNALASDDTVWGVSQSAFSQGLRAAGLDSFSFASRVKSSSLLGDTLIVFPVVRDALSPFTNYIHSQFGGGGHVIDMSFSTSLGSCNNCRLDLENVYGVNAASLINSVLLFSLSLGSLFRIVHVARTVGQSG